MSSSITTDKTEITIPEVNIDEIYHKIYNYLNEKDPPFLRLTPEELRKYHGDIIGNAIVHQSQRILYIRSEFCRWLATQLIQYHPLECQTILYLIMYDNWEFIIKNSVKKTSTEYYEKLARYMKLNISGPLMGLLIIGFAYSGSTVSHISRFRTYQIYDELQSDAVLLNLVAGFGNAIIKDTEIKYRSSSSTTEIIIMTESDNKHITTPHYLHDLTWCQYIIDYIIDIQISDYSKHDDILSIIATFHQNSTDIYGPRFFASTYVIDHYIESILVTNYNIFVRQIISPYLPRDIFAHFVYRYGIRKTSEDSIRKAEATSISTSSKSQSNCIIV